MTKTIISSLFILTFLFFPVHAVEVKTNPVTDDNGDAVSELFHVDVCDAKLKFVTEPRSKAQTVKLNETVSLSLNQFIAVQKSRFITTVATNVICQKLVGADYSGTEEEWIQFIQQASSGMQASGGKSMRLELVGEKEKVFLKDINNREYRFYGEFKGVKQTIHNVAILDKENNIVYTLSVSGEVKGVKAIREEFARLVESLELPHLK